MTYTIWKKTVEITDTQQIGFEYPGRVISAAFSRTKESGEGEAQTHIDLWFYVDQKESIAPPAQAVVHIRGTGHPLPSPFDDRQHQFIATLTDPGQPLVWHVFVEYLKPGAPIS